MEPALPPATGSKAAAAGAGAREHPLRRQHMALLAADTADRLWRGHLAGQPAVRPSFYAAAMERPPR